MATETKDFGAKKEKEPFDFELLRHNFPGLNIPTPLILSEEHVIPALSLLRGGQQGKSAWCGILATALSHKHAECPKPVIIETSGHDGDSGGYSQSTTEYPCTQELVDHLVRERLVSGKPEWGYTDDKNLLISARGREELGSYWRKMREEKEKKAERSTDAV